MKKNLMLSGIFAALFLLLIVLVRTVDVAPVGPAGTEIGLSHINQSFAELTGVNKAWYAVTEGFGFTAILVVFIFAGVGLFQLIRRGSLAKVDRQILAAGVLYVVVLALYVLFEFVIVNYRPVLMGTETFPEASFPSSHTMLICTVMGSAILLLPRYEKKRGPLLALRYACGLVIIVTVLGRLISGVHWFSDIVGGVLISLALLFAFAAALGKPGE